MVFPVSIKKLSTESENFTSELNQLISWEQKHQSKIEDSVRTIIDTVREKGDEALLMYSHDFDQRSANSVSELKYSSQDLSHAFDTLPKAQRKALETASNRIKAFHQHQQLEHSWQYQDALGNKLGQKITPLDSVGLYVPGGQAAYPSSVLMNAIPAKIAGVENLVMVCPLSNSPESSQQLILAAAHLTGIDHVYELGGAHAVAGLAYGTETLPAVDKIVGPGNIFVATAKKMVFGKVGIDMIAGPTEVAIIADDSAKPEWLALDLMAQAEHDELAQSILISPDTRLLENVEAAIMQQLPKLSRHKIIQKSLNHRAAFIHCRNLNEAIQITNTIAPEHLELATERPKELEPQVKHAGAIFMGHYSAEALGDYCVGTNHVLPTAGSARFASPLGVYDFIKRSSIIHCSKHGINELGEAAISLAKEEGLTAHAQSIMTRLESNE